MAHGHAATTAQRDSQLRGRVANALAASSAAIAVAGWVVQLGSDPASQKLGMLLFIGGWGAAALSYAFLGAFEKLALTRMIQDMPTTRIRSAPQGYIEIRGVVRTGGETIVCPACGRRCQWFQYYKDKGKSRVTPAQHVDIVVDDGSGVCLLRPQGADVWSTRRGEGQHAHICPGDPVFALGEHRTLSTDFRGTGATGVHSEDVTFRQQQAAVRQKLRWLKYDARRVAVFDVNRDGRLDARELAAMAKVAESQANREQAQTTAKPTSALMKPSSEADRLPFVIVVGSERDAIKANRVEMFRRTLFAIVAGLFIANFLFIGDAAFDKRKKTRTAPAAAEVRDEPAAPVERTPRQQAFDLHREGRLAEAIVAYDAALRDNVTDAELYFWRGAAHGRLGHDADARTDVERACQLGDARGCEMVERLDRR